MQNPANKHKISPANPTIIIHINHNILLLDKLILEYFN